MGDPDIHGRRLWELISGDVVFVDVGAEMKLTRIEDEQGAGYMPIDDYRLGDGVMAALSNE